MLKASLAERFPNRDALCAGCYVNKGIKRTLFGPEYIAGHEQHGIPLGDNNCLPSCPECERKVGAMNYWSVMSGEAPATDGVVYRPCGTTEEFIVRLSKYLRVLGRDGTEEKMESDDLHWNACGILTVETNIAEQNSQFGPISDDATAKSALVRAKTRHALASKASTQPMPYVPQQAVSGSTNMDVCV